MASLVSVAEDRDIPMPSEKPLAKRRRLAAQRVREARERLTSTTGTRVAFDYELLRQFAENRLSASLVVLLLVGTVGFLSSLWTGAVVAGAWTAAVLVIHAVIVTKCRQFLSEPPDDAGSAPLAAALHHARSLLRPRLDVQPRSIRSARTRVPAPSCCS